MYNDFWMVDNGFIDRPKYNDLRDLIARRHLEREDYVILPNTPMAQVIRRMRMFGISQMAVVNEHDKVVGILDESDVLMALATSADNAKRPVSRLHDEQARDRPPERDDQRRPPHLPRRPRRDRRGRNGTSMG
jgi:predicted transcriptional regulator